MEYILELKGITKRFGSLTANDKINLAVRKGTVHAVIGENGAGKSTLMNVISGLYRPDEGELFVRKKKVSFRNPSDASRAGIGMVHQEFMLFPELTVLDNIMMGYEKRKMGLFLDKKMIRKQVETICEEYHFNIPLDEVVQDLSVSMLQQVEIVKILYRGVDIIIFDEPTSVLTPQGIEGLFDAIRFLVKHGKTVLFITHKLKEVMEISDDITVLKNGHYVNTVTPQQTDEHDLATMMVGREVLMTVRKEEKQCGEVLLEVKNLSVSDYEGRAKLDDVSFCLRKGEILGIAGVAGSGQQELVESLFGLRKSSGGQVLFGGKDITHLNCRNHRLCHIGYVPQDRISEGINREASLWENAIMGYHIVKGFQSRYFLNRKQAVSFTERIIEQFNVKAASTNLKIKTLSGGNIQKLIVGREFLQDNSLLIIEDPTRGIDIGAIEFIWKKIESLAAAGTAILLVSHELNEVMEVSDRILVMYDGQLYDGGGHGEKTETEIGLLMTGGGIL
ncbi:MAG: ABC transporter ATP-binding protein [Eubacteriales bacterium]|nr:ABC transporter ATP-binding protein [Eubacteriales bacterium]